jgi:hypothetical protein
MIKVEPLCVEFCNFVQCHTFANYLSVIKFDTTLFKWHDHSVILKPQVYFLAFFIKGVLHISDTNMEA